MIRYNRYYVVFGLIALIISGACFVLSKINSQTAGTLSYALSHSIDPINTNESSTATIISDSLTHEEEVMLLNNKTFKTALTEVPNFYKIIYKLENVDHKPINVDFEFNQQEVDIDFSGLNKNDLIDIQLSGTILVENLPADWSGKLLYSTHSSSEKPFCFIIKNTTMPVSKICHQTVKNKQVL